MSHIENQKLDEFFIDWFDENIEKLTEMYLKEDGRELLDDEISDIGNNHDFQVWAREYFERGIGEIIK